MQTDSFNFKNYVERIGFFEEPNVDVETLNALMRCQLFTVPFENLDVQAGKIVSLDVDHIFHKIVHQERGGYCFEVNSLFAMALAAVGIEYYFVGARPMFYPTRRPKTHMAVIAKINGKEYLCDTGFGSYGIRAPIALASANETVQQDYDKFRLFTHDNLNFILQAWVDNDWVNQYEFDLYPHELLDFIPANYFNSKCEDAIFVQKLLVVKHNELGRKILLGQRLKTVIKGETQLQDLTQAEVNDALKNDFGLDIFSVQY